MGASPVEEAEGLRARVRAAPEDSVNKIRGDRDGELVECSFKVEVAANNGGNVVDNCKIVIFL